MDPTPLVSVIIPTYNQVSYLPDAIRSVMGQSYPNYEIIVADDGSTDDTLVRLQEFGDQVRVIRLQHSGILAEVRNRAIQSARGTLIAFLDSDDLWQPDKLSLQVSCLVQNPHASLVYCDVRLLFPDGGRSPPCLLPAEKFGERLLDRLLENCFIHPSTAIVRRNLFDQIGFFDEEFASQADYLFWILAAQHGALLCVPDPLVLIRKHPESITGSFGIGEVVNLIPIFEHLRTRPNFSFRQRLIIRRSLARMYTHLGLHAMEIGDIGLARYLFGRSVRTNPVQRRAWSALWESMGKRRLT